MNPYGPDSDGLPPLPQGLAYWTAPEPLELECGETLAQLTLAYQTWGDPACGRVAWVCHALTGNSNAPDWWSGLVGPGRALDPAEWFIVCANMPGSCYGSTGPLSLNPATGKRWYGTFPELTNRDVVRAFAGLRKALGISRIEVLAGGSLGGQQVLEWALLEPEVIGAILPMATNAVHSPWGIAFNAAQRMALEADPTFADNHPGAGQAGLTAARAIGMLSYRTAATFAQTQPRTEQELPQKGKVFRAESYMRYQGQKLVRRFNAHAYWTLSRMMDSHDLGRGRTSLADALKQIHCPALVVSINTDLLFPPEEQQFLVSHLPNGEQFTLHSPYGHDAFLIEFGQLDPAVRAFLARI